MRARTLRLLFTLLAAAALPALAQEHPNIARGFGTQASFDHSGIDSINKFNGNLNIRIPLGFEYPVNGPLAYAVNLFYSGNNWRYTVTNRDAYGNLLPQPSINAHASTDWNAGFGWQVAFGKIAIPPGFSDYAYQSPDGHWHRLYGNLHQYDPGDAGDTNGRHWMYTRDGSYLRVKMVPSEPSWEVHFPDGAVHKFDNNGNIYALSDRFGNNVYIQTINPLTTYQPHPNTEWPNSNTIRLQDDHGRIQYIHMRPNKWTGYTVAGPQEIVGKVELSGPGGSRVTYRLNYNLKIFSHPCTSNPSGPIYTWLPALTSVDLPDGTKYDMPDYDVGNGGYNCSDPNAGSFSGTLKSLTLPTHGKIEWVYREYQFPGNGEQDAYHSFHAGGVGTRRLRNKDGSIAGIRTYSTVTALGTGDYPPSHVVNTITTYQPDGVTILSREKAYFSSDTYNPNGGTTRGWYGLPISRVPRAASTNVAANPDGSSAGRFLSTEVFDAAGTLLRSTYARYEADADMFYTGEVNQRRASERTIHHDDPSCVGGPCSKYIDFSSFDGLGHYRYAVSGGNYRSANDTRTAFTNYNPGSGTFQPVTYPGTFIMVPVTTPWVLHTYPEQSVTEGTGTVKSQYCWDLNTGFLLRKRVFAGGSAIGSNDALTVYTPDVKGNLAREERFGGDIQALGTTDLCSLPLPANQFRIDHTYQYGSLATSQIYDAAGAPLSFKSVDRSIDLASGFVANSRDTAGIQTTYEYDIFGRPTWTKRAQGEWTEIIHGPASATVDAYNHTRRWTNGATAILEQRATTFDSFGRTSMDAVYMIGGVWSGRKTRYNGAGWVATVSEMQPEPAASVSAYTYDTFGRVRTITPPDGAAHQVTVSYVGDRVTTTTTTVGTSRDGAGNIIESNAVKQETYDSFGRLWTVTEQSGAGGANVTTTYDYDVHGQIKQAVTVAAEGTQTRTFARCGRGWLQTETLPEKGTTTAFSQFDALGRALRRHNAAGGVFELVFTYDRAGRQTHVHSARNGVMKLLKEFVYGTANGVVDGVTDYRQGKLVLARRHNWVGGSNSTITEDFYYGGKEGSISRRTTTASSGPSFTQTFTSNDLGDRATTGYPSCIHGCPGEPARTVTFNYTNGFLTSVPSYANAISYHTNGMISAVAHANGVTWNQSIAANAMGRPASIYTSGALNGSASGDWNSGAFVYDGQGNIVKMGADYFLYDRVGRVVEGTADQNGGATEKQTQTFDSFGNLTSFTTNGTTRSLPANAANNRLTSAGYDGNGNMTTYLSDTYGWDDLDAMVSLTPGTKGWYYVYNAAGERIARYNHLGAYAHWYVRDLNGKVLREYLRNNWRSDGSLGAGMWSWTKDYVYRGDVLLATVTPSETRHMHVDHLGTPRLITGPGAVVRSRHNYFAFGEEATSIVGPGGEERMKFTGHERDLNGPAGTEHLDYLDYMFARYYNPIAGRFLTTDPAGPDPRNPQSWNRYAYVEGNPLKYTDPRGLLKDCDCKMTLNMEITVTAKDPWSEFRMFFMYAEMMWNQQLSNAANGVGMSASEIGHNSWEGVKAFGNGAVPGKPFQTDPDVEGLEYSEKVGEWTAAIEVAILLRGRSPAAEEMVTVSRWGRPGLQAGDWVMRGGANRWNYLRSFKWQRGMGNQYAPFRSGEQFRVPSSSVRWPQGWGIDGAWKGIFGQRQYWP